ncbi:unnamed protein product, partial [Mesorhabditis spiculigera]
MAIRQEPFGGKNIISFLEEATIRLYQTRPHYLESQSFRGPEKIFTCLCSIKGHQGNGAGRSKKEAKARAAFSTMQSVCNRQEHNFFRIRGDTHEARIDFLKQCLGIAPTYAEPAVQTTSTVANGGPISDFVQQLLRFCQEKKLRQPEPVIKEERKDKIPIFETTYTMGSIKVSAIDGSKQKSKKEASRLLYLELVKVFENPTMRAELPFLAEVPADDEPADPSIVQRPDFSTEMNARAVQILAAIKNQSHVFPYFEYQYDRIKELDSEGKVQVMVKIEYKQERDKDKRYACFGGYGRTEEEAKTMAAHMALLLFGTFVEISSLTI